MTDIQKVTESILSDIKSLDDIGILNGDILSQTALRLSVNKVYVGQAVAELELLFEKKTLARKIDWGKRIFSVRAGGEKVTVREAEIMAEEAIEKDTLELLEMEKKVSTLKNLRKDVSDVITTIQSRMTQLRSEMIEANGQAK